MKFNRILIATDDSPQSEQAVKTGFELAKKLDAAVALVYVIESNIPVGDMSEPVFSVDLIQYQKKQVEKTLKGLVSKYGNGTSVQTFHPEGLVIDTIVKTSEEWKPDMLVMGSHARTGIEHLIMGSIAEHTIRYSKVPVLVIPYKSS
ncbi:MAG: universal stress protein [Bacteroidia bacterium]